jgi:hypothetical protein
MKPPIADPFEKPVQGPDKVFYPSFWPLFAYELVLLNLGFIPYSFMVAPSLSASLQGLGIGWLLGVVLLVFPSLIALMQTINGLFFQAVTVGPEGVTVRIWWWISRTVAWDDIQFVKRRWTLPPLIVIQSIQKRKRVSMSALLRDMEGFAAEVEQYTEADHPLRVYLAKRGY